MSTNVHPAESRISFSFPLTSNALPRNSRMSSCGMENLRLKEDVY